ncbi:MAG: glycoside hydrolase family 26 protein [Acidobacteriaceae bacterium]
MKRSAGIFAVLLLCLAVAGCPWLHSTGESLGVSQPAKPDPKPAFFGRRLEPRSAVVLHGAGQSDDATFEDYSQVMGATRPMLYMSYVDLKDNLQNYFAGLHATLERYPDFIIPQIGLSLNQGQAATHYEDQVAAGALDNQLALLCTGLQSLDRPVFLRIGYEFNGQWNGYEPASYIAAFRRIVTTLRACHLNAVAAVWDFAPDGQDLNYMRYYPGDDVVDWWAVNLFSESSFTSTDTQRFLDDAESRRFPVMIGESTPRFHSVTEGQSVIDQWYQPYFQLILSHPQIKAFCYINWNWAKYEQWADWGNARIQDDPTVLAFYKQELSKAAYASAGDRKYTLDLLGATADFPAAMPEIKKKPQMPQRSIDQ